MKHYSDFDQAISSIFEMMKTASAMHRGNWQGVNVSRKPEMEAFELLHLTMAVPMSRLPLDYYRKQIEPNLPWADHHFIERICGHPLNPGKEWENWPWGKNADKFRLNPESVGDPGPDRIFDHTYSQRYWSKQAGRWPGGIIPLHASVEPHRGIYFDYGDLNDVVTELEKDPTTRQAILPIFFPEDTGHRPGRRKPCSISYHFMLTSKYSLDIFYHLRSCDLIRHFRDDIYLTVRLLLWMLDQLRSRHKWWNGVAPGTFVMYIGNLHCFKNDMHLLRNK